MNQHSLVVCIIVCIALPLGAYLLPRPAHAADPAKINGLTIVVPPSSIPRPGRIPPNYLIARSDVPRPDGPPQAARRRDFVACFYKLVKGPKGCPIAIRTNHPTRGWGASAIVDAGDFPTAKEDLHAFSKLSRDTPCRVTGPSPQPQPFWLKLAWPCNGWK
jgi:hypothetical protein